ncbi:MAG: hypothetical protein AB1505_11660 [Candidatus Latescibacterota bacterium]
MSRTPLSAAALAAALLCPGLLGAQNVQEPVSVDGGGSQVTEGRIDWTENTLTAYGEGLAPDDIASPVQRRLMGLRAARTVAYRNLLELVGQVRIDAETRVDRAMVTSDSVRLRVSGIVRGARVVPGSQEEVGGLYRVALELRMLEGLADAVLPASFPQRPAAPLASSPPAEGTSPFVPPAPYTGLVVDARGLDLQPSISPRVLAESGKEVYSAAFVDRGFAVRTGVVGYHRDWDRAMLSDRLGDPRRRRPLVVRALDVSGAYRADVVLGTEDAVRVAMADAQSGFLGQCRVVFVLGPASPASPDSAALAPAPTGM